MHPLQKYNIRQTAHGARAVQSGNYQNHQIEVVTGYDVSNDRFPVHVYITPRNGQRQKIDSTQEWGSSEQDGFELGWRIVDRWLATQP